MTQRRTVWAGSRPRIAQAAMICLFAFQIEAAVAQEGSPPPEAPAGQTPPEAEPPADVPATEPQTGEGSKAESAAEAAAPAEAEQPAEKNFFKASKADGVNHRPQPPSYVQTFDQYGLPGTEDLTWLEFGLEHRTRFEYRDDDYRNALEDEHQFLLRTDVYIGIRDIFDPLRFGFEFQDSRQFQADFPENVGDVDQYDVLQGFGELYFKDALGPDRPLSFRVGRQAFDLANRRQVARNGFRNTTNAFDGFRLTLGQQKNDWQVDVVAVMPVERLLREPDRPDEERWLYGFVHTWRGWSDVATIETFYFVLDEDRKDRALPDREVHSIGTHVFGPIGKTGFDYDVDFNWQFGNDGDNTRRAYATHAELGYTFNHAWKPRLAVLCNYATGDQDATDHLAERFDPMFSDSTGYGYFNIQRLENLINPNLRLQLKPHEKIEFNGYYRAYWLARDEDRSNWGGRIDPTGRSGDCVGQAVDLVMKYKMCPKSELEIGYAHFFPGSFIGNTGPAEDSDFLFVAATVKF